ncbi:unnamed protein product [Rhizoctonia solani]|uniref:SWIM-type domain-containing protein n=1 Tax=Rhizoctonia solani TaxID=456999 RepID=A0A8H3H479_9AGAM|nr:unnamed protein product [Rhizoctonia solani]
MATTTKQIIDAILAGVDSKEELEEDAISSLHRIFQHTFLEALDLIDRGKITRFTHQGRDFIRVAGSDKTYHVYLDLMDVRIDKEVEGNSAVITGLGSKVATTWCPCEGFFSRIIVSTEEYMCEHVLAALLAIRLGKLPERRCNNHELYLNFFDDLHV